MVRLNLFRIQSSASRSQAYAANLVQSPRRSTRVMWRAPDFPRSFSTDRRQLLPSVTGEFVKIAANWRPAGRFARWGLAAAGAGWVPSKSRYRGQDRNGDCNLASRPYTGANSSSRLGLASRCQANPHAKMPNSFPPIDLPLPSIIIFPPEMIAQIISHYCLLKTHDGGGMGVVDAGTPGCTQVPS